MTLMVMLAIFYTLVLHTLILLKPTVSRTPSAERHRMHIPAGRAVDVPLLLILLNNCTIRQAYKADHYTVVERLSQDPRVDVSSLDKRVQKHCSSKTLVARQAS